jgi:hypothetical protein
MEANYLRHMSRERKYSIELLRKQLLTTYIIGSRKRQRSPSLHSDTQSTGHQSGQSQRTRRSRSPFSLQSEAE